MAKRYEKLFNITNYKEKHKFVTMRYGRTSFRMAIMLPRIWKKKTAYRKLMMGI